MRIIKIKETEIQTGKMLEIKHIVGDVLHTRYITFRKNGEFVLDTGVDLTLSVGKMTFLLMRLGKKVYHVRHLLTHDGSVIRTYHGEWNGKSYAFSVAAPTHACVNEKHVIDIPPQNGIPKVNSV